MKARKKLMLVSHLPPLERESHLPAGLSVCRPWELMIGPKSDGSRGGGNDRRSGCDITTERVTLFVPEALNDGTPVPPDQLAEYESELLDIVGAFTLTHGIGAWRSDSGLVYREPVRLYALDVVSELETHEKLLALATRIALELVQEAVYLTKSPVRGQLVIAPVPHEASKPLHRSRSQLGETAPSTTHGRRSRGLPVPALASSRAVRARSRSTTRSAPRSCFWPGRAASGGVSRFSRGLFARPSG